MVTATRDDLIPEPIREISLIRPLTADDLATFPDDGNRYEIIGGALIVSPAPSRRHQSIVTQLITWLNLHVLQLSVGEVYGAPFDVHLSVHDLVQPDILFVSSERLALVQDKGAFGAPDLVVEVVSPSSGRADRVWKAALYARSGVREYWLVDPVEATIDVQSLDGDLYVPVESFSRDAVLQSPLLPDLHLDLTRIFLDIPSDDALAVDTNDDEEGRTE